MLQSNAYIPNVGGVLIITSSGSKTTRNNRSMSYSQYKIHVEDTRRKNTSSAPHPTKMFSMGTPQSSDYMRMCVNNIFSVERVNLPVSFVSVLTQDLDIYVGTVE